jgi:hypothetical protein
MRGGTPFGVGVTCVLVAGFAVRRRGNVVRDARHAVRRRPCVVRRPWVAVGCRRYAVWSRRRVVWREGKRGSEWAHGCVEWSVSGEAAAVRRVGRGASCVA